MMCRQDLAHFRQVARYLLVGTQPSSETSPMRGWLIPVVLLAVACSSNDRSGPGTPVDSPTSLSSTTLDGAIALTWSDNSFASDPGNFQNYRVYSATFDFD